ncbi:D-glycero-alpha-D-manno-heptose-1,7-bisphosphate 7-phosphatase [Ignavibacteria bacterium]|nr:HAD family hydrolase [Bacteroidota bacterium]MCZ2133015.1 HAD family hydrolase [Bacteroidota bacterium]
MNKAVFFDRDGIVNSRIYCGYVTSPEDFVFIEDFFSLFNFIRKQGCLAVVITNQQGVGKGLMTQKDLDDIHDYMQRELAIKTGTKFDAVYSCTDLATVNSFRRKPNPGMLLEAAQDLNINLAASLMIGDSISDVQAGKAAGTRTILVGDFSDIAEADIIAPDINSVLRNFSSILL